MSTTQSNAPQSGHLHVVLGAGAVGAEVARQAIARGHRVRVATRSGTANVAGAESVSAEVSDPDQATRAAQDADVIHFCVNAPYHRWPELFPPLQHGAIAAAEKTGALLIVVENLYAYGDAPMPLREDTPFHDSTVKGRVRGQMSGELFAAHAAGRIRATSVRGADYYGPTVTESAFGDRFFPPLLAGKTIRTVGDLDVPHAVTFVPDVAATMLELADRPQLAGRPWHVPTAPAVSQRRLAEIAAHIAGSERVKLSSTPPWVLRLVGRFNSAAGEVVEMLHEFDRPFDIDSSDAQQTLGLTPTSLEAGLAATVAWYRSDSAGTGSAG